MSKKKVDCPTCEGTGRRRIRGPRFHKLTEPCQVCGALGYYYEREEDDEGIRNGA